MRAAAPFLLATIVIVQAGLLCAHSSGTIDETAYLRMTEAALLRHDNAEFPLRGVAPLPVLIAYTLPVVNHVEGYAAVILLARGAVVAFVAVPIVLVVYFWMRSQFGTPAGFVAAALTALSPSMVAHGSLATTDACFVLFALIALWTLARYVERPTWGHLVVLIIAGGLVFAAKYSGVVIIGVAALTCAWNDRPERPLSARIGTACLIAAAMLSAGIVFTWNYHPIDGLQSQIFHQRAGHEAFLLGRRRSSGWWYYQLFALGVKSTYVELAALVIAPAAFITLGRKHTSIAICGVTFAAVLMLSMASHVSIGVRYVLPLIPLSMMAATAWAFRPSAGFRVKTIFAVAAVAAQAAAAVIASPDYLSYFNGLGGGPMNGYRLLADSNVDWGQDLPAMRRALAEVGAREPLAAYFGSAPPDAYGVNVWLWHLAGPQVKLGADWIVISATYLDGLYLQNDPFQAFRAIAPTARPTPSLFLYDASRAEVKAALAVAMARTP